MLERIFDRNKDAPKKDLIDKEALTRTLSVKIPQDKNQSLSLSLPLFPELIPSFPIYLALTDRTVTC